MAAIAAGYIRLSYNSTSTDFKVLAIVGQDDPDWFELYPAIVNTYLDGTKGTQFQGFRRRVRVDLGVVSTRSDRLAILYWMLDNARTIDYGVAGSGAGAETSLPFVPQQTEYQNEWIENCSLMRRFVLELDESVIRTTFPTA
jgi:hypothetical protein